MISFHQKENAAVTLLTTEESDPTGYGRVIRNSDNTFKNTVEEKDIRNDDVRQIKEIAVGTYLFQVDHLFKNLLSINNNNMQREYYLPDVLKIYLKNGQKVSIFKANNINAHGINTIEQLKIVEKLFPLQ